jgi:glycosyltransferase involved in cell wall biosynthesis
MVRAEKRPVRKIGYMGFDKTRDLNLILPQLIQFLDERPDITFELMGSFLLPEELLGLGDRVKLLEPVRPYSAFLEYFATLGWDIGLAPLGDTPFNRVKTNTKWVEYTMAGAAVIATADMAYDECCADDCGVLVTNPDNWLQALRTLSANEEERYRIAANAQRKLVDLYSPEKLRRQVLSTFEQAQTLHKATGQEEA